MPDTVRTDAEILALLADNTSGQISAQDVRDAYVTLRQHVQSVEDALAGGGGTADSDPDQFTFTDIEEAFPSAQVTSNEITLTGFNVLTIINVTGGSYSKNGGPFTTAEGFAQQGDKIRLKVRAADLGASPVSVTFTAGQISDTWTVATGNVWVPAEQPEMMVNGFFQEDLADGGVSSWTSRGVAPLTLTGSATKLPDGGGVLFQKGTTQSLATTSGSPDSTARHRWWLAIARADLNNNPGFSSNRWPIINCNRGDGGRNHRHPSLTFRSDLTPAAQMSSLIGGQDSHNAECDGDFANWNVLFGSQRGWRHICTINGVEQEPGVMDAFKPRDDGAQTWVGAGNTSPGSTTMGGDMAIDCVIIGQGEPNDAFIDKLIGWAHWRAGRVDLLPTDHPYKNAAPLPDGSEGEPARYIHEPTQWATFKAASKDDSNYGNAPPALSATYKRVFFDDFLEDSIVDDVTGDETSMWFAPGWNTATGVAQFRTPSQTPDCYPVADSRLTLRLQENSPGSNSWITGQIFTVNKAGKGRWWGGDRIIKAKIRFINYGTDAERPRPDFFPSMWGYGHGHLHWRTRNRIEPDWFEHEGLNVTDSRIAQTLHIHTPAIPYSTGEGEDEEILAVGDNAAIVNKGSNITISDGFGEDFAAYDEQWHVYEWRIDNGFIYNIIDDFEVGRKIVCNELMLDTYHIFTNALRGGGNPPSGEVFDMDIDWVEVWKKDSDLAVVPAGFSARPTLSGSLGGTITLTPNATNAGDQLEIRWYRNGGEPIIGETGLTFDDSGALSTSLRVYVRNLSALSQPEAWTEELTA